MHNLLCRGVMTIPLLKYLQYYLLFLQQNLEASYVLEKTTALFK